MTPDDHREPDGTFSPGGPGGPGRPSLYREDYAARAVAMGREGKSPAQIAAALGVARSTLDGWADAHPAFAEALAVARTAAQAWWEERAQAAAFSPPGEANAAIINKAMQARFREDYTERRAVEHSGAVDLSGEAASARAKLARRFAATA